MFERRLKILLIVFALPTLLVVARLVELQILRADTYQDKINKMFELRSRDLPCLRGRITDRNGYLLAYDAPLWDIAVHYGVTNNEPLVRKRMRRSLRLKSNEVSNERIGESWQAISELTGMPMDELRQACDKVTVAVTRVRESVSRRRGVDTAIQEEVAFHPIIRNLNQEQQVAARVRLAVYPWVDVVPSQTRRYEGGPAFGRILGLLNEVSQETIDRDPADDFARYRCGDLCGFAGAETLGEHSREATGGRWLRGRRGCVLIDRAGHVVETQHEPQNGKALRLTIDQTLQKALYNRLAAAVEAVPTSTGGAAVVLDVPSRQVLAMVSYPSFDPSLTYAERLQLNEADPTRKPFDLRAIGMHYHPGSIVKPLILAGAMADGSVSSETRITCNQYLFPERRDRFTCTGHHGSVDPVFSIQHSCNIFYYKLGEKMGIDRLAYWMGQFGLGQRSGTGLPEEASGGVPTSGQLGHARSMAIGQWSLVVTPIQAANMTATLASGVYRPVAIWMDDPSPRQPRRLKIPDHAWRMVRQGMYEAVNKSGGTAFTRPGTDRATLIDNEYVLSGKTGTPERGPRKDDPPDAWFVGYLARHEHYLDPAKGDGLNAAIAVVIERSGHGGDVAGPVARDMMRSLILHPRNQVESGTVAEAVR